MAGMATPESRQWFTLEAKLFASWKNPFNAEIFFSEEQHPRWSIEKGFKDLLSKKDPLDAQGRCKSRVMRYRITSSVSNKDLYADFAKSNCTELGLRKIAFLIHNDRKTKGIHLLDPTFPNVFLVKDSDQRPWQVTIVRSHTSLCDLHVDAREYTPYGSCGSESRIFGELCHSKVV